MTPARHPDPVRCRILLSPAVYDRLELAALEDGEAIPAIIESAIVRELDRREGGRRVAR